MGRTELPLTGTYTLRVQGGNVEEDGGSYRLQVVALSNAPESLPQAITADIDRAASSSTSARVPSFPIQIPSKFDSASRRPPREKIPTPSASLTSCTG